MKYFEINFDKRVIFQLFETLTLKSGFIFIKCDKCPGKIETFKMP